MRPKAVLVLFRRPLIRQAGGPRRPADRGVLDGDTQLVGVPSDVPSAPDTSGRYYFCLVTEMTSDAASFRSASSGSEGMAVSSRRMPLNLSPLLPTTPCHRYHTLC